MTFSSPSILFMPLDRVVFPEPLSPATAKTKTLPESMILSVRDCMITMEPGIKSLVLLLQYQILELARPADGVQLALFYDGCITYAVNPRLAFHYDS